MTLRLLLDFLLVLSEDSDFDFDLLLDSLVLLLSFLAGESFFLIGSPNKLMNFSLAGGFLVLSFGSELLADDDVGVLSRPSLDFDLLRKISYIFNYSKHRDTYFIYYFLST